MEQGRRGSSVRLLLAGILLTLGAAGSWALAGPSVRDKGAAAAQDLLARLRARERPDLAGIRALPSAATGPGILVRSYPELAPLYSLCPILGPGDEVLGIVAVDAGTSRWIWYSLNGPGGAFPVVGAAQAGRVAAKAARGAAEASSWGEPRAVRLPDGHLYWMFDSSSGSEPFRCFVDWDDPRAVPLLSGDGTLEEHLRIPFQEDLPSTPPPVGRKSPAPARKDRPMVCVLPGVPFHFQVEDWFCGCASVQMLMDYYGKECDQYDISDVANDTPRGGTGPDDNRRACHFSARSSAAQNARLLGYRERALGYAANEACLSEDPYGELKDLILHGTPVEILTCYDRACNTGHYRVVKGYDDALQEFIVHDPWYGSPFYGPDVHFDQTFLVENLWNSRSGCWALMTGPWDLRVSVPAQVPPRSTFQAVLEVSYPGRGPFAGQYPASAAFAAIDLPTGFVLCDGTATVSLPVISSGDSVRVVWNVRAGADQGTELLNFRAAGLITGSTGTYASYTDSIGGLACGRVSVGPPDSSRWTAEEPLSSPGAPASTSGPNGRSLCVEPDGIVHAVWADDADGNSEIHYRLWSGSWGPDVRLTHDDAHSVSPVIAGSGRGDVHVAWVDTRAGSQDIFFKSWDGAQWSPDQRLSTSAFAEHAPAIAADGRGNVWVAWQTDASPWTRISVTQWDGTAWSQITTLGGSVGHSAYSPSLAADSLGRVYLLYEQDTAGRGIPGIYCRTWTGAWSSPVAVSGDGSSSHCPSATIDLYNRLHVVWHEEGSADGGIYYRLYNGAGWEPEIRVVDEGADAQFVSVAADRMGDPRIVWQDFRDGAGQIYTKRRNGPAWSMDERITSGPEASTYPCLAMDRQDRAYLLWMRMGEGCEGCGRVLFKAQAADSAVVVGHENGLLAWPNPAHGQVHVGFRLFRAGPTQLGLFDVSGRRVRTLLRDWPEPGYQEMRWDGKDELGRPCGSGVYLLKLDGEGVALTGRIVVIKR